MGRVTSGIEIAESVTFTVTEVASITIDWPDNIVVLEGGVSVVYLKSGDTAPALQATLQDGGGTAIDLTGATVRFHMRQKGAIKPVVDSSAALVTPASGVVQYAWSDEDTALPGEYEAEFEVTYPSGIIETFPSNGFINVTIRESLA